MKGLENPAYFWGWVGFNILAVLFLVGAIKKPRWARFFYFFLFLWACITNWTISQRNPSAYLEYAELAFTNVYRDFINGWFSDHIQWSVGFIATCQGMIALSMLMKGRVFQWGCAGGIVFLVAIAPLGVGSGFPCTLIFAAGLVILFRKGKGIWEAANPLVSKKELQQLLGGSVFSSIKEIDTAALQRLPPVIQQWLIRSGIRGKNRITHLRLMQKGKMRTKPGSRWMPFMAEQYFTIDDPGFIWKAHVKMLPFIHLCGKDQLKDGRGNMLIKLFGFLPVVHEKGNDKIHSATMVRYLAEMAWFPSAALNEYIKWEPVGTNAARAFLLYKGVSVSGIFTFDQDGDLKTFSAMRYMGSGRNAKEQKWLVEMTGYKDFSGWRIPYKNKVTWQLAEGDFTWAEIELTKLDFNLPVAFK